MSNLGRVDVPLGPRNYIREFIEGFDSAGGGWRTRIHALAILTVLAVAIAQHALTRWILAATVASILVIAATAWGWRRIRAVVQSSEVK